MSFLLFCHGMFLHFSNVTNILQQRNKFTDVAYQKCAHKLTQTVSELHFQAQSENKVSIQLLRKYSSAGEEKQFYSQLRVGEPSNACFKCFQMCE